MDLNLFQNLKKDIESNTTIKKFIDELSNFLKDTTSSVKPNSSNINNENLPNTKENLFDKDNTLDVKEYRKNEIYLWDFTDKPKHEFKEIITSVELQKVAKEGAMLQYKNGKYELYSPYGYDMLHNENK